MGRAAGRTSPRVRSSPLSLKAPSGPLTATRPKASPRVAHAEQPLAAVLDLDPDRVGAGVEGVFDELLHPRGRPLDHLAGGDLVRYLGREDGDPGRHKRSTSVASTQPRTPSSRRSSSQGPYTRSTISAAPPATVAAGLALPYGATRTAVVGFTMITTGRARRSASRAVRPAATVVPSVSGRRIAPRRPAATPIHTPTPPTPAPPPSP